MTDRELENIRHRYRRALGGVQKGRPPAVLTDLGNALTEIDALRHQLDTLIEEQETTHATAAPNL